MKKNASIFIKRAAAAVVLFSALTAFCSCSSSVVGLFGEPYDAFWESAFAPSETDAETETFDDTETSSETEVPAPPDLPQGDAEPLGIRSFMDGQEAEIYDVIYANVKNGVYTFDIPFNAERDDRYMLMKCIYSFNYDHPEFFVLDGSAEYDWRRGDGRVTVTLGQVELPDGLVAEEILKETKEKIDEVSSAASSLPTDFDKILYVHDYIVNNTVYDASADDYVYTNTPYGCLVKGRCVCGGYASAFSCVMHALGINCLYVFGSADNGVKYDMHGWNLVESEGEWYVMDVTWDDTGTADRSGSEASYDYFCITTEEAMKNHYFVNRFVTLPICTATELNYHRHLGLYLEEYSFDGVKEIFDRGFTTVKFSDDDELEKAVADLFVIGKFYMIESVRDDVTGYYAKNGILTLATG